MQLEWARELKDLVTLVGTVLLFFYVLETYRIRLATVTSAAPSLTLIIADAKNRPRLQILNIEGRVARNIRLDGLIGVLGSQAVRCTFTPIPHLGPRESTDLKVQVEGLIESPEGHIFYEADTWREVLRSATGKVTGLPLRMRYEDGTGMAYVVRVTMPNRIDLGFTILDRQPSCSPPRPLVTLNKMEDRIIWPVVRALMHRRIRREVTARPRRQRASGV